MQNQAIVATEKIPYAGRDVMPGEMFHVEQPEHALIFKSMGQARDLTADELKAQAEKSPAGSAEAEDDEDEKKRLAKEKAAKDLRPDKPGQYRTRDMGVETNRSKVTKGE